MPLQRDEAVGQLPAHVQIVVMEVVQAPNGASVAAQERWAFARRPSKSFRAKKLIFGAVVGTTRAPQ